MNCAPTRGDPGTAVAHNVGVEEHLQSLDFMDGVADLRCVQTLKRDVLDNELL